MSADHHSRSDYAGSATVDELVASSELCPGDAIQAHVIGCMALATDLGSPREWCVSALAHLQEQVAFRSDGGALVSVSALHLTLAYVAHLEQTIALLTPAGEA